MLTYRIKIFGIVQSVGFRPTVYKLVQKFNITGTISNNSDYVEMFLQNVPDISLFFKELKANLPVQAKIQHIDIEKLDKKKHFMSFEIIPSKKKFYKSDFFNISPDIAICNKCKKELREQTNNRFQYPFITCTDCGPRFSIIKRMPYDRCNTTMNVFNLCPSCYDEYVNPENRRFHAETICCEQCGPTIDVNNVVKNIKSGKIVAIKGIGGFHLVSDAQNIEAVSKLRFLKKRKEKPFAIMFNNINEIKKNCFTNKIEQQLLCSKEAPIVLLKKKNKIYDHLAPNNIYLGVMLAYTPLHLLITKEFPSGILCTSANLQDEPIIYNVTSALKKITTDIYDHSRKIKVPLDDSIVKVIDDKPVILRRARGYVPNIYKNKKYNFPPILALGAELKNTFSLARGNSVLTSQHWGDTKNISTQKRILEMIHFYEKLHKFEPKFIVCDKHPAFSLRKFYEQSNIPIITIQHHHAHMCAAMLENNLSNDETVLGVIWDGMGYGDDNNLWGGEFLLGNYEKYKRVFSFDNIPLPGGDICTKEIWRLKNNNIDIIEKMIAKNINTFYSSSVGRLFDKVVANLEIMKVCDYEGQAATLLEQLALPTEDYYNFLIIKNKIKFDMNQIISDNCCIGIKSMKFHNTLVQIVRTIAKQLNVKKVVLAGGCFVNSILLSKTLKALTQEGISVYFNQEYPVGDGAISFGQTIAAYHKIYSTSK